MKSISQARKYFAASTPKQYKFGQ